MKEVESFEEDLFGDVQEDDISLSIVDRIQRYRIVDLFFLFLYLFLEWKIGIRNYIECE